ncbi:hypothetical protein AB0C18_10220 [Nonomuraea muscovyensis]|uniref:hypothetical protein n=1 Tax=Nonomuraea muscovyensis TaxID=1124761 RepID=UPI00340EF139|nr:hypothetical protein [Nonomuraea muscovyensis]
MTFTVEPVGHVIGGRSEAVGDVLELLDVEARLHVKTTGHAAVFYRMLHSLVSFAPPAPTR